MDRKLLGDASWSIQLNPCLVVKTKSGALKNTLHHNYLRCLDVRFDFGVMKQLLQLVVQNK